MNSIPWFTQLPFGFSLTVLAVAVLLVLVLRITRFHSRQKHMNERMLELEVSAHNADQRYQSLVESSPDAIVFFDADSRVLMANNQAVQLFRCDSLEQFQERSMMEMLTDADRPRAYASLQRRISLEEPIGHCIEYTFVRRDGSVFPGEVSSGVVLAPDGSVLGVMRVIRDVSDRKAIEYDLRHQATHDTLTSLPNRTLFDDRASQAIKSTERTFNEIAVLLMDLNGFKDVNDTFGHQMGDQLLKCVAMRLTESLRDSDTISRFGGDEFAILLPATNVEQASVVAEKIRSAFVSPFAVGDERFTMDASIGVASFPIHGETPESLIRCADIAMYAAKRTRTGFMVYDASIDSHSPRRLALVSEIHEAIARDDFTMHYQPKIDIVTGSVRCVEALVRWFHPSHGHIAPTEFIPLVERTDLINPFTRWVLRAAFADCQRWRQTRPELSVAVNLSAWNLHDDALPDTIVTLLAEFSLPADMVRLEVTETSVMTNPIRAINVLTQLTEIGVSLAIDDFGTGYSSLAYLRRMPLHEIKIDHSFVHDLGRNREDVAIVKSVIDLGHSLGLEVVAEGVEDAQALEILARARCDVAQGYYFGRPMPSHELRAWLDAWPMRSQALMAGSAAPRRVAS